MREGFYKIKMDILFVDAKFSVRFETIKNQLYLPFFRLCVVRRVLEGRTDDVENKIVEMLTYSTTSFREAPTFKLTRAFERHTSFK